MKGRSHFVKGATFYLSVNDDDSDGWLAVGRQFFNRNRKEEGETEVYLNVPVMIIEILNYDDGRMLELYTVEHRPTFYGPDDVGEDIGYLNIPATVVAWDVECESKESRQ